MRNMLTSFLMLLMLVPGLACGGLMGAGKAQAASVEMAAMGDMPCHQGANHQKRDISKGMMLMKDCAKTDLFASTANDLKKPDTGNGFYATPVFAALMPHDMNIFTAQQAIRGPPPGVFRQAHFPQTPIFLTTLRLRQ